jgi:dimethylaniline monooxygenase (N-oxide forming)
VHKYLIDYSEHFGLEKHARLKTKVHDARFDEKRRQWGLEISDDEHTKHMEYFDKVVFAMGTDQIPVVPNISGMEKFRGEKQHSFTFKR